MTTALSTRADLLAKKARRHGMCAEDFQVGNGRDILDIWTGSELDFTQLNILTDMVGSRLSTPNKGE